MRSACAKASMKPDGCSARPLAASCSRAHSSRAHVAKFTTLRARARRSRAREAPLPPFARAAARPRAGASLCSRAWCPSCAQALLAVQAGRGNTSERWKR
jgi:hypothetical protein